MHPFELEQILNDLLKAPQIPDYAPNGLQVLGKSQIKKIITGVTACQALLDYAVAEKADAVLVHHGYFWKNEDPRLIGMKGRRIQTLMKHDINLFAYHLPLDIHPILGNNAQLAEKIGLENLKPMEKGEFSIPIFGEFNPPIRQDVLLKRLEKALHKTPLASLDNAPSYIHRLGICTGGGQDYIDLAVALGLDGFLTGEVSERTIHTAREEGLNFFACGHHATEKDGIKALGEWLAQHHHLEVIFKDIPNPA